MTFGFHEAREAATVDAPELPIPEDLTIARTYYWLMAQMLYPDSPALAQGAFCSDLIMHEGCDIAPTEDVIFPIGWLRSMLLMPSLGAAGSRKSSMERWNDSRDGAKSGLRHA
jgi:hypothetical protein